MARSKQDRDADRLLASGLVEQLRSSSVDLRSALKALPAPASRNPAQRRDALVLRTLALIVQALLASWGVARPGDREPAGD